jgi:hypothetical protein
MFKAVYDKADQPTRDAMDLAFLAGQRPGDSLRFGETDIRDGVLLRDRRPPCPALDSPEDPPSKPVPTDDRRRSNAPHRIAPIAKSGKHRHASAARARQIVLDILRRA